MWKPVISSIQFNEIIPSDILRDYVLKGKLNRMTELGHHTLLIFQKQSGQPTHIFWYSGINQDSQHISTGIQETIRTANNYNMLRSVLH